MHTVLRQQVYKEANDIMEERSLPQHTYVPLHITNVEDQE